MLVDVQFLNNFYGNTRLSDKVKERVGWATVPVDVDVVPLPHLEPAFHSRPDDPLSQAWEYAGNYWVRVDALNDVRRGHWRYWADRNKQYSPNTQRSLAGDVFEFLMLDCKPSRQVFAMTLTNIPAYQPGKEIGRNDFDKIAAKAVRYFSDNLIVVNDLVYCRIEQPIFWARGEMLTHDTWMKHLFKPYGGYSDRVMDYEAAYDEAVLVAAKPDNPAGFFFRPIEGYVSDPVRRAARAVFFDMFKQYGWTYKHTDRLQTAKGKAAFSRLHELRIAHWNAVDDDVLDEAVDLILPLATDGAVKNACEAWINRPVSMSGGLMRF